MTVGVLCALVFVLVTSSSALAQTTPYFQVGSFDTGASALGVAVDQMSNDVYVGAAGVVSTVTRYDSSGANPAEVGACGIFGACAGVAIDPVDHDVYVYNATALQLQTYDCANIANGSGCNETGSFAVTGPAGAYVQIAADLSGNVYYPNQTTNTVQEFNSSGTALNAFSGSLTVGAFTKPQGVAVDSSGDVYVVDAGRVVKIAGSGGQPSPTGAQTVLVPVADSAQDVSVDPVTNDVFVLELDATSCGSLPSPCYHVVAYHADGAQFADFGAGTIANNGAGNPPNHLAVDHTTGDVYVSDYNNAVWIFSPHAPPSATTGAASGVGATGAALNGTVNPNGSDTDYYFEYGLDTSYGQDSPSLPGADAGAGTAAQSVSTTLTGLQPNQTYHYQLVATSQGGTTDGGDLTFTTQTATPTVGGEASANVTQTHALLEAQVNPNNQDAHYYFEQSTSPLGACPSSPAQTGTDLGSGYGQQAVSGLIGGLGPSSTYHYRAVAYNGTGVSCGPDRTFQTLPAAVRSAARAYELVSSNLGTPDDLSHDQWMAGLSPNGQQALVEAYRGSTYKLFSASRTPSGWQMATEPTGAALPLGATFSVYGGSDDGTVFFRASDQYASHHFPTYLYSVGAAGPSLAAHDQAGAPVDVSDLALGSSSLGYCIACAISADRAHFVFQAHGALTPGADGSVANVYESDARGQMTLVSTPSAGDPAPTMAYGSALGANYGAGGVNNPDAGEFKLVNFPNAISADGSRVYFSSAAQLDPAMPDDGQPHLYLRDLATHTTTLVSKSQVPGSHADSIVTAPDDGDRTFGGATPDGGEAFFLSKDQLTSDAPPSGGAAHLYEYDAGSGQLSYVARAADGSASTGTQAFVAVSNDGSHVFFTDTAELTADAPAGSAPKLYSRDLDNGGATQYIAPVSPDPSLVQVSDDGSELLLVTSAQLLPDDTDSQPDVYLWRSTQGLALISEGPSGGDLDTDNGAAVIGAMAANSILLDAYDQGNAAGLTTFGSGWVTDGARAISADGSWVFFSSREQLTPDASSAPVWKVYGYHDGELLLISPPGSADDAYFRDSSPNGSDVYFQTRAALVSQASGTDNVELYDARIGGGFPATSPPASSCPGNACDASPPAAPPVAATISFTGPGNVIAPATPRVKVTRGSVRGFSFFLTVRVPAPGRLVITGKGIRRVRRAVHKAGVYHVKVTLTARDKWLLARKHKEGQRSRLRLKLRVTYAPGNGTSSAAAVTVTIKPRGHRVKHARRDPAASRDARGAR